MQGCGERDRGIRHLSTEARANERTVRAREEITAPSGPATAAEQPRGPRPDRPSPLRPQGRRDHREGGGARRTGDSRAPQGQVAGGGRSAFVCDVAAGTLPRAEPFYLEKETDMIDKDRIKGAAERAKGKAKEWAG